MFGVPCVAKLRPRLIVRAGVEVVSPRPVKRFAVPVIRLVPLTSAIDHPYAVEYLLPHGAVGNCPAIWQRLVGV